MYKSPERLVCRRYAGCKDEQCGVFNVISSCICWMKSIPCTFQPIDVCFLRQSHTRVHYCIRRDRGGSLGVSVLRHG